jgi:hypothetical protein
MSINYNNINELLSLLYDFVYEHDKNIISNYSYEKLEYSNIKIGNLLKENIDYDDIIKKKISLVEIITTADEKKILITIQMKKYPVLMIIQKYKSNINVNSTFKIEDIIFELFMNQVISEFVILDRIPFFILNICNFNINLENIKRNEELYKIVSKEFSLYDKLDNNKEFCISLYENYHKYITLKELLRQPLSNEDLYNLFFQVIFIYAFLYYKLNNFYHGDYTVDSFLILINPEPSEDINLRIDENNFKLKNCKYICKLFNYRFSYIQEFNNTYNKREIIDDPSYEMYSIFKSIYDNSVENKKQLEKIKSIINNFLPIEFIEKDFMDLTRFANEYVSTINPIQILLKNNFFTSSINMNYKDNNSQGRLSRSLKKNIEQNSDFSSTSIGLTEKVGYRSIDSSFLKAFGQNGGAKKKSKSKKSSKSKKTSKRRMRRSEPETVDVYEEVDNIDDISDSVDSEDVKDKKRRDKVEKKLLKDSEEEIEKEMRGAELSIDSETQNEELETEGDDDDEKEPIYGGKGKKSKEKDYKKMYKQMLKENSKLKKKVKKGKQSRIQEDSSSLDLEDTEKQEENKSHQTQQPQQSRQTESSIMMPDPNLSNQGMSIKMKQGTNQNFNSIFDNLDSKALLPVLPEMQGMFDYGQIAKMQQMNPQTDFSSDMGMGGEPKVMDYGLMQQNRPQNLPMVPPDLAGMIGSQGMGSISGMGGMAGMGGMGQMAAPQMGPIGNALGELGSGPGAQMPIPPVGNVLQGGNNLLKKKKNFFLTKV